MIAITIVDSESNWLRKTKRIIVRADDLTCKSTYRNVKDACKKIPYDKPDMVLFDIDFKGENGIDIINFVSKTNPGILFIIYTASYDADRIAKALKAGAKGPIFKNTGGKKLKEYLKAIYYSSNQLIPDNISNAFNSLYREDDIWERLTKRQKEVFECASLLTYKETSIKLGIGLGTIKTQINRIYKKLGVKKMKEAIDLYNKRKKY